LSKALLITDMLRDFVAEGGALYIGDSAPEVIQNTAGRLKEWRATKNHVIYIMDTHLTDDAEFNMFPPHCLAGDWGGEIIDELAPEKGDYFIRKRRFSAFYGTDLDLTLRELGVNEIEIAGVCTQICVLYTAADARMRMYDVTVQRNCVGSFDPEAHKFALKEMENTLGVNVI